MSEPGEALVIATDDGAASSLATVLRTLSIPVRIARDSASLLAGSSPIVVIVHGHPSDRTAIELARELRARRGAACPRLVWIPTSEPRRVELACFDDVVRRPYRAIDLLERVRRLLRTSGTFATGALEPRALEGARRSPG